MIIGHYARPYLGRVVGEISLMEDLCLVALNCLHLHLVGRVLPRSVPATVHSIIIVT